MSEPSSTRRLRLFSSQESPRYRTRRGVFLGVYLLLFAGLTTPLFGPVWQGLGWFGVPNGFWWVMAAMLVSFFWLLYLYRTEEEIAKEPGETSHGMGS